MTREQLVNELAANLELLRQKRLAREQLDCDIIAIAFENDHIRDELAACAPVLPALRLVMA